MSFVLKKGLTGIAILAIIFTQFISGAFAADDELVDDELYVEEAYPIWTDKIEVIFSNEISEASLEDDFGSMFRMEDVNNPNEIIEVVDKELDDYEKNIMILTLSKKLVDGHEYKIIVLKIEDIFGQNIKFGVDSGASFIYYDNSAWQDDSSEEGNVEDNIEDGLNSAGEEDNNQEESALSNDNSNEVNNNETTENNNPTEVDSNEYEPEGDLGGISLDAGDVENQVNVVANDNSNLPTAGAEHILVLILALVLGGGILIMNYKKS